MKMTADNVTDATARAALTGKRLDLSDDDHRGLELGISPSGVRAWSLRVRDRGWISRIATCLTKRDSDAPPNHLVGGSTGLCARWPESPKP
jgi:hypothetical protein